MSQQRERYVRKCNATTSITADNVVGNKLKTETITPENPLTTEQPQGVQHLISGQPEEEDEFWPLSGKPHFDVIPTRMQKELPPATVPVVVTYCGKKWKMIYTYDNQRKLERSGWKVFADDNHLKIGDECVFELVECSNDLIEFKVQILRGDFPAELLERVEGLTNENPLNVL